MTSAEWRRRERAVERLAHVERFSHLMHLVSHVDGELREGLDAFDAFNALFPAGTLTGAPKVRAMELIDEFEPVYRGPTAARSATSRCRATPTSPSRSEHFPFAMASPPCRRAGVSSPTAKASLSMRKLLTKPPLPS